MKILVGNNRLQNPGGSETYTYALTKELVRLGHDVECVASGNTGIVSDKIRELGVFIHFGKVWGVYDLALLSHKTSIALCENVKAFKIQTCHGIFPDLEQPVKGMNAYVAITEEVKSHLKACGFQSTVILNGIDCDRFYSGTNTNPNLRSVLSLVHSNKANELIKRACDSIGCNLLIQNKYNTSVWEIEELINKVDLVVSLGRGSFEAAACERNVIIFDQRQYMGGVLLGDGILTYNNFSKYIRYNNTGRFTNKIFTENSLVEEFKKYNMEEGERLRKFVYDHMNITKQVQKYLKLIK